MEYDMDIANKPIIIISKCLGFENCRYNEDILCNDFIENLKEYAEIIPVCPEVQCGLSIPRNKAKLVEVDNKKELIQTKVNNIITDKVMGFSDNFLENLSDVDGFILKCKSPSCGVKDAKIYGTLERSPAIRREKGIFAESIIKHFPYLPLEDDSRLNNIKIREHFLTRIFILADFREAKKSLNFDNLKKFHLKNTLLFISYSQKYSKALDSLIYTDNIENIKDVFSEYEFYLYRLLERTPRYTSNINVLMKSIEQFRDKLKDEELQFIWSVIDKYRNRYISFAVPLYLVKSYVIRFELENLLDQSFFMPYPEKLVLNNETMEMNE